MIKSLFLFQLSLLILACGSSAATTISNTTADEQRPESSKAGLTFKKSAHSSPVEETVPGSGFTDSLTMRRILNYLASDELEGRDSGSEGIEDAALFIEQYFDDNGLKPFYETYRDSLLNYKLPAYNLVGWVPGQDESLSEEIVVIGAHYDHIGKIGKGGGDIIANGANDNASGTATVMELARYFGTHRTNKRSILFVLFSAEEKGLLGSTHLARRLKDEDIELVGMLNFEMTGVPMAHNDYLLYVSGYKRSNLAELCNDLAGERLIGFLPTAEEYQLFRRSDNYPFHQVFGVPSQTFCTFDFTNYDYYHRVEDEAEKLDYHHMARVVNKMIPVVLGLSNTEELTLKYY